MKPCHDCDGTGRERFIVWGQPGTTYSFSPCWTCGGTGSLPELPLFDEIVEEILEDLAA